MVFCSSPLLWKYNLPDVVRRAADIGYAGVEVWVQQAWWRGDEAAAVASAGRETGMALSAHAASWDLNVCALNDNIRRTSLAEVLRSLEFAADCGADVVTVHPGRLTVSADDLERHWQLQVEAFQTIGKRAASLGLRVGIELMESIPKEFIIRPEHINRLVRDVGLPHVGVTFDVAHVPLNDSPTEWLLAIERPMAVHLSDSSETRLHLPLGEGTVAMEGVVAHAVAAGLPIILEGFEAGPTVALAQANKAAFDKLLVKTSPRAKLAADGGL